MFTISFLQPPLFFSFSHLLLHSFHLPLVSFISILSYFSLLPSLYYSPFYLFFCTFLSFTYSFPASLFLFTFSYIYLSVVYILFSSLFFCSPCFNFLISLYFFPSVSSLSLSLLSISCFFHSLFHPITSYHLSSIFHSLISSLCSFLISSSSLLPFPFSFH